MSMVILHTHGPPPCLRTWWEYPSAPLPVHQLLLQQLLHRILDWYVTGYPDTLLLVDQEPHLRNVFLSVSPRGRSHRWGCLFSSLVSLFCQLFLSWSSFLRHRRCRGNEGTHGCSALTFVLRIFPAHGLVRVIDW